MTKKYDSDLTDQEWEFVKELIQSEFPYKTGRKKNIEEYRDIVNAMFYIVRTGVQWAYLPKDYPPHTTVHYHYMKFMRINFFEKFNDAVRDKLRIESGKKKTLVQL
jgi:putative transposase